jgi:hypothetical protein
MRRILQLKLGQMSEMSCWWSMVLWQKSLFFDLDAGILGEMFGFSTE